MAPADEMRIEVREIKAHRDTGVESSWNEIVSNNPCRFIALFDTLRMLHIQLSRVINWRAVQSKEATNAILSNNSRSFNYL